MTDEKTDNDSHALDVLTREAGLGEMQHGTSSPGDRRFAKDLVASYQSKIAEARRALVPEPAPIKKAPPIRPSLLAKARDALLAQLTRITDALGPSAQLAYRDLDGLSDDDLRRLIQTLDPNAE
ncbi:MAG TPA: hypothetical protein VGL61_09570 [Kofleriaceae bacterium]|jgi:hypothetical protein